MPTLPFRLAPARAFGPLLGLLLLGASSCGPPIEFGLPTAGGGLPIEIILEDGLDPGSVAVALDGVDVTSAFAPGGRGLLGTVAVPEPGRHRVTVSFPFALGMLASRSRPFEAPTAAPAVVGLPSAGPLPAGAWLRFRLAAQAQASDLQGFGFALECDGRQVERAAHALADGALLLDPTPALPPGAACRATWRGVGGGVDEFAFAVAPDAAGTAATVLYERASPLSVAPFPDDYWIVTDASTPSGVRVGMPDPPFTEGLQAAAFSALTGLARGVDGWSRQSPIVVPLSHPLDPSLVPASPSEAQDPFVAIALVDIDPTSPSFGQRVPYRMLIRTDPRPAAVGGGLDHSAMLFPTLDLREQGRYALVFTRRAFAAGEPGRGFGPAPLFAEVLAAPEPGESVEATRARAALAGALDVVANLAEAPIPPEDVALALSISIRTHPSVDDLVRIKEQALAGPPPELVLPDLDTDPCPTPGSFCIELIANRAVEVRGRVRLPRYRDAEGRLARDAVTGNPQAVGFDEVPLVMTLPRAAVDGPVLPVMYQHGNPGTPAELLGSANEQIDDAGFALVGIRDTLNRELCPNYPGPMSFDECMQTQILDVFGKLMFLRELPNSWLQTGADQIHFLRAIQGMGSLDLIGSDASGNPVLGPDGNPEIDPSVILYKGISEGANNAQRFLPFAPEILAAEATVGGARLGETLIHQSADRILSQLGAFLPFVTPTELWVGLALFQSAFDPQDGHTYLRHLYQAPLLPFAGSSDVTPPSSIWTEGLGDTLVPNNASRAMARELGIPQVGPVLVAIPGVEQLDPPVASNVAPGITAGYYQIDPATAPGSSCRDRVPLEGHYCPQTSAEARAQRLHFLMTALEGDPEIVDAFSAAD